MRAEGKQPWEEAREMFKLLCELSVLDVGDIEQPAPGRDEEEIVNNAPCGGEVLLECLEVPGLDVRFEHIFISAVD